MVFVRLNPNYELDKSTRDYCVNKLCTIEKKSLKQGPAEMSLSLFYSLSGHYSPSLAKGKNPHFKVKCGKQKALLWMGTI